MTRRNFADPDYEPTDEDLAELMREAFAGVRQANEHALARLRQEIEVLRVEALKRFAAVATT